MRPQSLHVLYLSSQTILACFAIALWVHLGPIPRLVLLTANFMDFSLNFNSSIASLLIPLSANRLTVAVSDVLNPSVDDMSRGMGYDGVNAVFSPQVLFCLLD